MSLFCPFSGAAQAGMSVSAQGGAKQKRVPFSRPGKAGTMAMPTGGRMLPACGGLLDARLADQPPRGGRTYAQLRQDPAFRRLRCPAQQSCPVRYTEDPDPEIPKKKTKGWGNMSKTRMGKRVASLLLSLVMMLSLLPTTVYAEGADTGDTTDEIVGQATTSGDNTEGTGEPEPTGEGEDGSANVTEGEDGAATNDAVVEETIAPVNAEGVDAVANAESSGDEVSGADVNELVNFVTVNGDATMYKTLDAAIEAAEPVNGVITYTINGKVEVTDTGWVQVAKAGLTGLTKVAFVGATDNAEICITNGVAILADETYDIDVSFEKLKLRKLNPQWTNDYGHCTNYFTTWLRNTGAAENTVTYTDCTFPNGVCNNQYGKTVFDNCQFINATEGLYNLWVYGGNVELNGGKFSGTRGAKVYTEGTPETVPAVTIKDTSFDGLTEKAAIVVSKAATVTLTDVSANNCSVGLFQKDIEKSGETTTITANGEKISGEFNITAEKGTATAKNEFNISAGTFTSEVPNDYCADGFEVKANADGTTYGVVEAATAAAQIGETTYETLAEAFAAAKDGDTITLLRDCSGDGIGVKPGTFTSKGLTVDFAGHAYTVGGKLVGSSGTMSNGFQLNKNNKITFQNGAIYGDASVAGDDTTSWSGAPAILIQNYCDLTLSGMKVSGGSNTVYTMSNNCGNVVIENTTINAGRGSSNRAPFALDACGYSDYTGVSVTVKGTSAINGDIEVSRSAKNKNAVTLTLESGTVNGKLKIDSSIKSGDATTVTKSNAVNVAAPAGYVWDNGTLAAAVAQIGETGYASLQAAIDAVKSGGTIKLLQNVDLGTDNYLSADSTAKNVTIDLGNHAVTSAYKNFTLYLKVTNWTIQNGTIKNTNTGAYGTLAVTTRSSSATLKGLTVESATNGVYVKIASGFDNIVASITVEDGTKISGDQYGVYMEGQPKPYNKIRNGQEILNVNGGEITGKTAAIAVFGAGADNTKAGVTVNINGGKVYSEGFAIAGDGATLRENTTINISGGEVISTKDTAIYHPQAGTVTISGGEVYGVTGGVQMCAGTLNVTGGTISATGNGDVSGKTGDGSIPDGAAVSIVNRAYPAGAPTMTISGGTFTSAAGVGAVQAYGWKNNSQQTWDKPNASVSGGKFTSAVPENYCAEGFIPTKNTDNTYGVKQVVYVAETNNVKYETLQAAINAAARKATVTMLADTRENVTISTPYLTLDLNGFTLNGSTGERKPALTITARVTVMDSSEAKTGTIMREDTAKNSGVSSHYVIDIQDGWLTFESGIVKNDSGNAEGKGASLVRVGNDSVAKYPGLNIKGGTFTQNNFIVIKVDRGDLFLNGGTLNSTNSYAIEDWHRATVKGGTVNGDVSSWTYSGGQNSDLSIEGGTVNGNVESVSYDGAEGKLAKVKITGGTVNGTLSTKRYDNVTAPSKGMATIEITGGTFKNDPTKYVVESSKVTKNSEGKYGVEKAYLAMVGETSYYTMEDAFKAQTASGEAIVLLRDYTTGSTFKSGTVARVVDLDGYTWTCTGTDANSAAFEINNPNATLTVKNGTVVSSQLVGLIPSAMGGTITYDNSSLTFENVEMSTTATSGIETNGNNTNDSVKLVNSTLNVPNGFGIYFPSSGTLTIDNSKINAKTMGVQVCAGSLSINAGSAITVTGDAVPKTENDGAIQDGAAISIVNRTGYKDLGKIKVTGGTFTAKTGNAAIKAYDWKDNTESAFTANDKINVSGGTFSSAVPEGLCADGFIPTENTDGTYGVKEGKYVAKVGSKKYETLADAIGAAQDGDTVTLLKDIDLPATAVVKRKTITLDLNGKTISNSTDIWNESINAWSLISVRDNGDLTINDTAGGGTLKAKENDCYALDVQDKDTALTVNAGTYVGNISAIYAYDGKVTINGGHFSIQQKKDDGDPYRFTLNCYDSNYKADSAGFTVNGGTFENFDPRNNPAEGAGTSFVAESVGVDKNTDGTFTAKPNMAAQIVDAGGGSVAAYAGHYDAIAAAKDGETVILLSDRKNFVTNTINANITIDLNGKTLSVGNNNPFFCTNGEVTIQNGTIESNYACAIVNAYNKLTLKNVKITGVTGDSGKNLVNVCSNAEVTIDKDTVLTASGSGVAVFIGQNADAKYTLNVYGKVIQQNKSYAISGNGSYEGATTINIYEGAEVRSASVAIYHPQAGEINVYGGLVEGYCGIGIKSGTLNITGGQVLGVHDDDELSDENSNPNGMTYDGSAIIIDSRAAYAGNVKINISGDALVQSSYSTAIREIGESAETTNVTALNVTGGKVLGASGKAAIQLHGVTADVTSISGGEFSSIVKKEYCAPGFTPVTTANSEGRYGVEIGKFTVQVTSRTVSSESPVANVSGGGSNITYAVGTTVTAASLSGYKFVGWFVNEYVEGNEPVSKELSFKFQPTDHCKLIAVYEPISGAKFYLTVNASEFTVGESAVYDSYMHDQVAAGESVTVTFKGTENFLYWVNASRKVVSTNPAYTFIMGSETTLSAVYGKTREAQATVVFMSDSDQIITSKAYKSGTAIQFPTPPIKMGCTFEAWSMTEKEIQDAIAASNNGVIVVKACYTDPSTPYTVTVLYPDDTKEEYSGMVGKTVTLTAKKISGKTFSYWRDSKNNVLGYTTTLMLAPSGNITVTAVYGDTAEVKPVITMTAVEAGKAETSYYVISFTATRAVPEGYTVVKQGILYSVDSQCTGEGAKDYMKLTDEGSVPAGIYEFEGNNTELSGVTLLHAKVGAVDRTIYGRGYMVLKNSSGTMEYVYSDNILSGSYSGLTKIGG